MADLASVKLELARRALGEGFAGIGVTGVEPDAITAERLQRFLALGRHGDMRWMADNAERRSAVTALWPQARSLVMLARPYPGVGDPQDWRSRATDGIVSCYAKARDYHDVMKPALKRLAAWLAGALGCEAKVFVDTAPLMEKPLAARAGLGWQGKHTNLVSRRLGSWHFLAAILTTVELPPDQPETDHCGSCRRCLDICPTAAFPAPYQLDARRCISYLTIEHKGHIAAELRPGIGNRVFGCDDCLAACPWNKFAEAGGQAIMEAGSLAADPPLVDLLRLDDAAFRARFRGTPLRRTGRDRFLRNVLIAAGNSGEPSLVPAVVLLLADASPLVRAMAVWALGQLATPQTVARHRDETLAAETDPVVLAEWQAALQPVEAPA